MYDKHNRRIDVQMLVRRTHIEIAAGGSLERLLTATPRDVLTLMPLDLRTPDEVSGSIYGAIARGDVTPRYGRQMMDRLRQSHRLHMVLPGPRGVPAHRSDVRHDLDGGANGPP